MRESRQHHWARPREFETYFNHMKQNEAKMSGQEGDEWNNADISSPVASERAGSNTGTRNILKGRGPVYEYPS